MLRLPHKRQPRPQRRPRAPQLHQEALCTAPATQKAAAAPAAPTRAAAPPGSSVYCACHTKGSRGPSGAPCAAAPPQGSVYCACHTKGSRGSSGASRRLCVQRLPHERQPRPQWRPRAPVLHQEALCTAPATRKAAAAPAVPTRAVLCLPRERQPGVSCDECCDE